VISPNRGARGRIDADRTSIRRAADRGENAVLRVDLELRTALARELEGVLSRASTLDKRLVPLRHADQWRRNRSAYRRARAHPDGSDRRTRRLREILCRRGGSTSSSETSPSSEKRHRAAQHPPRPRSGARAGQLVAVRSRRPDRQRGPFPLPPNGAARRSPNAAGAGATSRPSASGTEGSSATTRSSKRRPSRLASTPRRSRNPSRPTTWAGRPCDCTSRCRPSSGARQTPPCRASYFGWPTTSRRCWTGSTAPPFESTERTRERPVTGRATMATAGRATTESGTGTAVRPPDPATSRAMESPSRVRNRQ